MEKGLRRIVVGVDASDLGDGVLRNAFELAVSRAPTEVHALRVIEPMVDPLVGVLPSTNEELARLEEQVRGAIQREIQARGALAIASVVAHVVLGAPARALVELAAQLDADTVVVGTHGRRGLRRALLGSVAEEVVRTSGCPVLVVRPKDHAVELRVPTIEPLCDECAQARQASGGAELWCARHREHHPRAHVYHYDEPSVDSVRPWGFHG